VSNLSLEVNIFTVYFETGRSTIAGTLSIATGLTVGVAGAITSRSWKVSQIIYCWLAKKQKNLDI
jgi:hypothetical protein